jgi:hypothetical protein
LRAFSWLGLNLDKAMVLGTRPPSTQVVRRLGRCFPGIKFVTKAKYLWLLVGPGNFRDKFFARAQQLQPIVRTSTLHQRIHIYNVYLLPILFYLAQFYTIPFTEMVRPISNHCKQAIGAFNGGTFDTCHIFNTPRQ